MVSKKLYIEAKKYGADSPYDLQVGSDAIDVKYRVGSGDSGTLKKLKDNAARIRGDGLNPVLLILRTDGLPAAVSAFKSADWKIYIGKDSFSYVKDKSGVDLEKILQKLK